jgi:spore germination cell wall hydrolase CwlJ-like protein
LGRLTFVRRLWLIDTKKIIIGLLAFGFGILGMTVPTNSNSTLAVQSQGMGHYDYFFLDQAEVKCLALNVYWEARNESTAGKIAVSQVVLNRVRSNKFPNSICGVIKDGKHVNNYPVRNRCQFSWYCDGKLDVPANKRSWKQTLELSEYLVRSKDALVDITDGATHYHASYVNPRWSYVKKRMVQIDTHVFYK